LAWLLVCVLTIVLTTALAGPLAGVLVTAALLLTCPAVVGRLRHLLPAGRRHRSLPPATRGTVFGPAALRSAHEAELEALQTKAADETTQPPVQPVGSIDMTDFEIALWAAEAEQVVPTQPGPAESADVVGLRALDLDELCVMWQRSSVQLRQQLDGAALESVWQTRQRCLDELLRRKPAATRAWMEAAGLLGDDPRPYLTPQRGQR